MVQKSQVYPESTRGKLDSTSQCDKGQRICVRALRVPYFIIHFTPFGLVKMAIITIALLYSKSLIFWIPVQIRALPHLIYTKAFMR